MTMTTQTIENAVTISAEHMPVTHSGNQAGSMLTAIMQMAQNPDTDVSKVQVLLETYQKLESQEAKKEFASDLAALQGEMPHVEKKRNFKTNDGRTYRNYDDIMHAANPLLRKHGFSIKHQQKVDGDHTTITTTLLHRRGHSQASSITLPNVSPNSKMDKASVYLSVATLAQKRNVEALLNISGADEITIMPALTQTATPEQAEEIKDLIAQISKTAKPVDMDELLRFINAKSIDEMLSKDVSKVKRMLSQRLAQAQQTQQGGE